MAIPTPQANIDTDQGPRVDTSLDKLGSLKSAFIENGTVTAGNSSPISDGASLTALATDEFCRQHALIKRAQVLDFAVVGIDPCLMGIGPVPAVRRVLKKTGLTVSDIDAIELNEAFAAQAIACIRELQLAPRP